MFNPDVGANKTKMVAWFVSNCNARNRRLEYARELAKHVQVLGSKIFKYWCPSKLQLEGGYLWQLWQLKVP